jgi:hypothetical protein
MSHETTAADRCRLCHHRHCDNEDGVGMSRPKGSGGTYVVASKLIMQRLICKDCDIIADLRVDADDKTNWPLHKCRKTRKAEQFSTVIGVPKMPVRDLSEFDEPKADPYPYLKVIG